MIRAVCCQGRPRMYTTEPSEISTVSSRGTGTAGKWPNLTTVLVLLLVAGAIHGWLLAHTEVTARDGIGFIRYAWRLEHRSCWTVLKNNLQHPLYPLSVLAMSQPVRCFWHEDPAGAMALSAQLVSAIAGILLVVPMFYLGRALFDRGVGFWAALLFQCLPIGARATADALSEGLFLLLTATALWLAVSGLARPSRLRFGLCGLFIGLAYLARPEGALTGAAVGLVLLGTQALSAWRRPWRQTLSCTACLGTGVLSVALPFVTVTGRVTTKPTARSVLGLAHLDKTTAPAPAAAEESARAVSSNGLATRPLLAVWWTGGDMGGRFHRLRWGVWAVATELIHGFHYIAWLPALWGLWWCRPVVRPGGWVLMGLCLLHGLAIGRVAGILGYVSDRHVLVIVLCGLFWTVAALRELPRRWLRNAPAWSCALLLVLAASGLPKALEPLHANRAGHRSAGQWLARHAHPADAIEDPFCWAHYYAGWVFLENVAPPTPAGYRPHRYVVVEHSRNPHTRLTRVPHEVVDRGTLVFQCRLRSDQVNDEEVRVYRLSSEGSR